MKELSEFSEVKWIFYLEYQKNKMKPTQTKNK